ncbi:MAG: aconitase X [Thermoanaerobaculia bacterium]
MTVALSERDRARLAGDEGEATALALRVVAAMAEVWGASDLLDIESAHVDGCLHHGRSGIDFAERLLAGGARVVVPTTLNVGAMDLLHPENVRGDEASRAAGRRLMEAYERMGCRPVWTCAPYQAQQRPPLGAQIAWAESNAIVFANSVLGARTNRYGDFIDVCAALTGRAPNAGLHRTENRRGRIVYRLEGVAERLLHEEVLGAVLGYLVGEDCGTSVPVLVGLPATVSEDTLKALGAAAASSGAVALFHAVGITPEAPDLSTALHGEAPDRTVVVGPVELRAAATG